MLQDVIINAAFACAGLAVPHHKLGIQIAHGPLSIAIGLVAGSLLGLVCALTPVWSSPLRRAVALLTFGELLAFCGCVLNCSSFHSLTHSLTYPPTQSLTHPTPTPPPPPPPAPLLLAHSLIPSLNLLRSITNSITHSLAVIHPASTSMCAHGCCIRPSLVICTRPADPCCNLSICHAAMSNSLGTRLR